MQLPVNVLSCRERTSTVWLQDGWIIKRQPKYLTDNEIYALRAMHDSGYVPDALQVDIETIRMEYIRPQSVTDADAFMAHRDKVLAVMRDAGLRHGDLSTASVLVRDNRPVLIDWAESRMWNDPRPDKRPAGDEHWLTRTMKALC